MVKLEKKEEKKQVKYEVTVQSKRWLMVSMFSMLSMISMDSILK